jgi:hypothetical protein
MQQNRQPALKRALERRSLSASNERIILNARLATNRNGAQGRHPRRARRRNDDRPDKRFAGQSAPDQPAEKRALKKTTKINDGGLDEAR